MSIRKRRRRTDADFRAEIESHIEIETERLIAEGLPPEEARGTARRAFGNVTAAEEKFYESRRIPSLDSLRQDVRYACRTFAKNPGFAVVVVLTLALGIGVNTAIFSLMNAVMLKPLPVEKPEALVEIRMGQNRGTFSNPVWEQIRDRRDIFDGAIAYWTRRFNLASTGETRFVDGIQVSGSYFDVLGIKPVIGRLFTPEDDRRGCESKAVIGYGFWKKQFGGAADVIGKAIALDGGNYTIIGVTPGEFFGVRVGHSFDVAAPICTAPRGLDEPNQSWLRLMGRLQPGMTIEEAQSRLTAFQPVIREATMPRDRSTRAAQNYLHDPFRLEPAVTGSSSLRIEYGRALMVLMAIAGLVLLVTCGNIASFLLARTTSRAREIAVRVSIGASRARLVRQLLIESMVLGFFGAAAGILLAPIASRLLAQRLSTSNTQVFLDVSLDWRVLAFTVAAGVLTSLLFGIVPAFQATNWTPAETLRFMTANSSAAGKRKKAGRWLVSFQMGLSLTLIFGAALFLRSYWRLTTGDHGFDRSHVLLVDTGYNGGDIGIYGQLPHGTNTRPYSQVLDAVRALPGVQSAAYSFTIPIGDSAFHTDVNVEGFVSHSGDDSGVSLNEISAGYFTTFGTAILAGRDFDSHDIPGAERSLIVNEAFARKFLGGKNPVGTVVGLSQAGKWLPSEIVGLVQDAKYNSLREPVPPTIYELARERISTGWVISIKTAGPPAANAAAIAAAIEKADKTLSITTHTFQSQIEDSLVQERLMAALSVLFGVLALLIAAVGLAGLVSYTVTRRRSEIGIRAALGATPASLVRLMMRDVLAMTMGGLIVGIIGGLAGSRFLSALLYEIQPDDPFTIGIAAFTLTAVAAIAGYIPARRVLRVDPMQCLRSD